jgi:anti-sigma factor RsiW
MSNLLQQLENNEAVLLMYLAGELPETDRAEVDQMLAGDSALRLELAELASMQEQISAAFVQADSTFHLSRRDIAVREVGRAINNAKAAALQNPKSIAQPKRSRSRIPFWAYPTAVAAMLVVGIMIFTGNHQHPAVVVTPDPTVKTVAIADVLPHTGSDDSLTPIEKEAYEVATLPNTGSRNFGGADPLDWDH